MGELFLRTHLTKTFECAVVLKMPLATLLDF